MSTTPQAQSNELDARACLSSYLILGGIFAGLTLFGLYVAISSQAHDWNFVFVPVGILVLVVLWLWSIRLKIAAGQLSYRILFWTRSISLTDIEKAETRLFGSGRGEYRALVIYPRGEKLQKPIRVNIKVFSREDLRRLFDLLGPKFHGPRTVGVYTDESA